MRQLSLYDIVSDKDKLAMTPEVWGCMKTCANFTNIDKDGIRDYFPSTGSPRCVHSHRSKNWKSKVIDNLWHTWCLNYRPKER